MEKTPSGTSVGVDDPYEHAGLCDHLTDEGKCRYAFEHPQHDLEFARERREDEYRCPVVEEGDWADCPHYRCRNRDRECVRCGLEERRMAHSDERPLLEEHHLSYGGELRSSDASGARSADATGGSERSRSEEGGSERSRSEDEGNEGDEDGLTHEITVYLCRWCHAKIHDSWARIDDDVNPDPEALAAAEDRRSREQSEATFESAADRYDRSTE